MLVATLLIRRDPLFLMTLGMKFVMILMYVLYPTIVGSLTNLGMIDSNSIDAVYSAHNIEHLFEFEV